MGGSVRSGSSYRIFSSFSLPAFWHLDGIVEFRRPTSPVVFPQRVQLSTPKLNVACGTSRDKKKKRKKGQVLAATFCRSTRTVHGGGGVGLWGWFGSAPRFSLFIIISFTRVRWFHSTHEAVLRRLESTNNQTRKPCTQVPRGRNLDTGSTMRLLGHNKVPRLIHKTTRTEALRAPMWNKQPEKHPQRAVVVHQIKSRGKNKAKKRADKLYEPRTTAKKKKKTQKATARPAPSADKTMKLPAGVPVLTQTQNGSW